jgi:hypothetical protein
VWSARADGPIRDRSISAWISDARVNTFTDPEANGVRTGATWDGDQMKIEDGQALLRIGIISVISGVVTAIIGIAMLNRSPRLPKPPA